MRILMLSWEYPPKNVGGLSTHVYRLSHALKEAGNEVHVITCEEGTAPVEEEDCGVFVHRVEAYKLDTNDFTKWVIQLNFSMIEAMVRLINKTGSFDIIHAHDWLVAFCARTIKWSYNIPVVTTIHETEYGRNNGIHSDMQRYISSAEKMLSDESWRIITCSNYMRQHINDIFSVNLDKICVIPDGIKRRNFDENFDWAGFRRKYAEDDEKIVFYYGAHEFERGIHLLVEAAPNIKAQYERVKFIIAGKGSMTGDLRNKIYASGLGDKFAFYEDMGEEERDNLYKVANAAVFPSLYEPVGTAAVEAAACGCPVVVSDTGGFSELIEHGHTGLKCLVGIAQSVSDNVLAILKDDEFADSLRKNASDEIVNKSIWENVSEATVELYRTVLDEAKGTPWERKVVEKETVKAEKPVADTKTVIQSVPEAAKKTPAKRTPRKKTTAAAKGQTKTKTVKKAPAKKESNPDSQDNLNK